MVAPWVWAVAAAALAVAIAAEVVLGRGSLRSGASGAGRSGAGAGTTRRAIGWVGVYVSLAVLFGLALGVTAGWVTAGQFYTGYLTEYSLSLDNLFVFSVIMTWFAVPPARQPRILLLGIGLALVMRSGLIVAGAAALNHFGWLFYPFGAVLVWTAIGLIRGSGDCPGRRAGTARPAGRVAAAAIRAAGGRAAAPAGRGDRAGRPAVRVRLDPGRIRHHDQRAPGRGVQRVRPDGAASAVRAAGRGAGPDRLPEHRPRPHLRLHRSESCCCARCTTPGWAGRRTSRPGCRSWWSPGCCWPRSAPG